jgi:hypothetical protein
MKDPKYYDTNGENNMGLTCLDVSGVPSIGPVSDLRGPESTLKEPSRATQRSQATLLDPRHMGNEGFFFHLQVGLGDQGK